MRARPNAEPLARDISAEPLRRYDDTRARDKARIIGVALDLLEQSAVDATKGYTAPAYSFIAGSADISVDRFSNDYDARANYIRALLADIRSNLLPF